MNAQPFNVYLVSGVDPMQADPAPQCQSAPLHLTCGGPEADVSGSLAMSREVQDTYPLTSLQQGMLFQWQLDPRAGINVEQLVCTLPEELDVDALRSAWACLIARHAALRTAFRWGGDAEPMQEVFREGLLELAVHDLTGLTPDEQDERLRSFLHEDRRRGFALDRLPLMRVTLFRLGQADYRLVWTFHHIVLDARSIPDLLEEVFDPTVRDDVPPSFGDFVRTVASRDLSASEAFFRKLLEGVAPVSLPATLPGGSTAERIWGEHVEREVVLNAALTSRLRVFAAAHGVTVNTLVQAAWALALSAFTGSTDVVFGTVRACRHRPIRHVKRMAGMLINTVPFRTRIPRATALVDWLKSLREQQTAIREHEATPLTKMREWSPLPGGAPLINTLLLFDNRTIQGAMQRRGDVWAKRRFVLLEKTEFALSLGAYCDETLLLKLEYATGVFERELIEELLGLVRELLEIMPESGSRDVLDLPTMTRAARERLRAWSEPLFALDNDRMLPELFEAQAARSPDAVALIAEGHHISYRALNERANRLAHFLLLRGVGRDTFVGIAMPASASLVVSALAVMKAGAAYVPLDPSYPDQQLRMILEDTRPMVVLTMGDAADQLPIDAGVVTKLEEIEGLVLEMECTNPHVPVSPQSCAVVIFTSGSTGRPKGVLLTAGGVANHNQSMILQWRIAPGDRVLQVSTVNFDASIEEIFVPLTSGATLVIAGADTLSATSRLLRFIDKERITILDFTTLLWHEVVHYLAEHDRRVPSSVRLCLVGGERATRATYNTWLKVGGDRIRWINTYGPAETTIASTLFEVPAGQLGREMSSDPPIGRAIANTFVYVLDSERRLAPPGVTGELYIGGVGVARGYLNQPELTVERFTRDPFREGAALMYQTGDRVRHRADGELEYLGRIDTQVKLRGYRIELGEIEAQLATHPAIRDGAVALRPTPSGSNALIAYVVPAAEATVAPDDILTWLQERVPSFMVPSMGLVLKSFPQTPNGKVDRNALPAPDWSCALTAALASPIEGLLATVIELWQEILDIPGLQPNDDFFALGGDSLRAMRLASKIEARLGHTVPLALLLQHRTAEQYARALQEGFAHEELSHLVLIRDGARRQPLFFIQPIFGDVWGYRDLADVLESEQAIYGVQMRRLGGELPPHQTIEECAADYLSLIQSVQPHGPYVLAGYSAGGLIAYEMACQLVSLGEEVDFLGLIDTAIPPKLEVRLDWMNPQHVGRFVWNFAMAVASLRYYKPRDMLHFIALCLGRGLAKLWPRSRRRAAAVAAAWPGVNPQQYSYFVANFTAHHLEFIRTYLRAVESFVPRAYPGHVHLFRSERAPLFSPEGPLLGWERVPMGSIEATKVKGLHWNMLDAAYVGRLAECMSQALRACGERAVVSMVVYGILPEFSSLLFRLLPEA